MGTAASLVAGERRLAAQDGVRRQLTSRARSRTAGVAGAGALVLLASAVLPLAQLPQIGLFGLIALLVFAPLLAGAAGALIPTLGDTTRSRIEAAILGLAAGFVSFLLYVASHVAATPDALKQGGARRLLLIVLPIGFAAGLTFTRCTAGCGPWRSQTCR